MENSTTLSGKEQNEDRAIWLNLREAIAQSSGFQRWQKEKQIDSEESLDLYIRLYLEETLETLAY